MTAMVSNIGLLLKGYYATYKGIKTLGLQYVKGKRENNFVSCADAAFAGNSDRRSYSGSVFLNKGGAVSWQSTKQLTYYIGSYYSSRRVCCLIRSCKGTDFLKRFIIEMWKQSLWVFSDSQPAITIGTNPIHHQRTKDIILHANLLCQVSFGWTIEKLRTWV